MKTGLTINGKHSTAFGLIINSKKVPLIAPIQEQYQEVAGRNGAWNFGVSFAVRSIEVDVTITDENKIGLRANLRNFIKEINPLKGDFKLIFDDDPDIMYFASLSGQLPIDQIGSYGTFTLSLKCTNPFAYSKELHTVSGATPLTIDHEGTHEATPIITVVATGVGTIINTRNDGTKQELRITEAGTYTIDCYEYTISEGTETAYSKVSGDFFAFDNGVNTISSTGAVQSLTIQYRDTWL